MGVLFTDCGRWDEAQQRFDQAMQLVKISSDTRSRVSLFLNVADFRTASRDWSGAQDAIRIAEAAIDKAKFPSHVTFALTIQADCWLGQGRREEALRCIEQAHLIMSREHIDASEAGVTTPNMIRWLQYRAWALGQLDCSAVECIDPKSQRRALSLAATVELTVFKAWLAEQLGCTLSLHPNARQIVRATGLFGVEARMKGLGLFPRG
jgi:tetratricopeptide (TPR) repeat protein